MNHKTQRQDLAAALRWAAHLGWQQGICNHFSLAVDADGNAPAGVLINPQGYQWSELTASMLLLMDDEGKVVEGDGEVEISAYHIHRAIHIHTPGARCVLHGHPHYATSLVCTQNGRILNVHQDSLRFHKRITYDDHFGGLVDDESEGGRIAGALGDYTIMMMAHHGITVTGQTVAQTFDDFYYLEEAARFQVLAASSGSPLKVMSDEVADRLCPAFQNLEKQANGHFASIHRLLEHGEPDYRL